MFDLDIMIGPEAMHLKEAADQDADLVKEGLMFQKR